MKTLFKKPIVQIIVLFVSAFLLAQTSFAYLSINETAELIKENDYRVGVIPQVYLTHGGGANMGAFFDMYVDRDINSRFIIGGGNTDFWTTASVKWVPYPDYEKQPAIGFRGAVTYARDNNFDFYNFQVTPIISKIVDTDYGKMNPYIGVPLTVIYSNSSSITSTQFVFGTEWIERADFQVGGELDLNLSNSNSALSFHVNFPFDNSKGFRK